MKKNRCITALLSLCLAFSSFSSSLLYAEATNNLPSVQSSENYNYISFEEFSKLSEEEIDEILDLLNEYLETHWLDVGFCRTDNFDGHIIFRAKKLLDAIEKAMGKTISGRDSEEVIKSFGDKLI